MLVLRSYQQEVVDKLKSTLPKSTHPLLVVASVGAGKSLIICELLKWLESYSIPALCLTLNSTLIKQNHDTYKLQGGECGIYCAGLNAKAFEPLIIFGSPHSICKDIKNEKEISRKPFKAIIIDESHNISPHDSSSMFMRIINHYSRLAREGQYNFKVVGMTGTPYRGKNESILGEHAFFKEKVCDISMSWLIEQGYLVKPYWNKLPEESYDFRHVKVESTGRFNQKQLTEVVDHSKRLTHKIMQELIHHVENGRKGIFIFATSRRHCEECARSLPEGQYAIITGETSHEEREEIISRARVGDCKYLISVNCLYTGIDIPLFDTVSWCRPTESLIIFTQGIGRALRLSPGKTEALVLDYAGNLERHSDIDDPLINEAVQPKEGDQAQYVIPCYTCGSLNTPTARRCIGTHNGSRCTHYFEFKECPHCQQKNDKVARECIHCHQELIDPNSKLRQLSLRKTFIPMRMDYKINCAPNPLLIQIFYYGVPQQAVCFEQYFIGSKKGIVIFYANFVKKHVIKPSKYYMRLHLKNALIELMQEAKLPSSVEYEESGKVSRKVVVLDVESRLIAQGDES